ncbi:cellulase family glycosylhydrolase [Kineococcus radiotolerans]|nr:cellulase family glycosylhydrolase [Kineococcus radiotolerans]
MALLLSGQSATTAAASVEDTRGPRTYRTLAGSASTAAAPVTTSPTVGMAFGGTLSWMPAEQLTAAFDDAAALGVTSVRADLSWSEVQTAGPDAFDWSRFDRVVAAARSRKLTVLPILAYTPTWARPAGCTSGDKCAPADTAAFAKFARAASARYGPLGVHQWEVWNEQNAPAFWAPAVNPRAYAKLLRDARTAIRAVDPSARVLMGGLTAAPAGQGRLGAADFLAQVVAQTGKTFDGVAFHPYTFPFLPSLQATWKTPWSQIGELKAVLDRFGVRGVQIWITEFGAPTGGPGTASGGLPGAIPSTTTHVTEQLQAKMAEDVIRTIKADPRIGGLYWYSWKDLGQNSSTIENFFGLRRVDGSPKPAYAAFRQANVG